MVIVVPPLLLAAPVAAEQAAGGTAVIRGRVITADTGQPLRGVQITIVSDGTPRTMATTDDRGAYEIRGLAGAIHILGARPPVHKAMYLPTGRTASGDQAYIEIDEGQILEDIDLVLPRAGASSGRVLDEFGEPIAGMPVQALEVRARRLLPVGNAVGTDDEGRFRVYGLPPGLY